MDKKELIRKSAIKVIARDGFHNAKVKTIADEAEIAAGTVYLYFKNKDDILDYIFCVEHQKRVDLIKKLYNNNESVDKIIDVFLDFYSSCFRNEPDTAQVIYKEAQTVSSLKDQKARLVMDQVFDTFSRILKREQTNGKIKGEDRDIDFLSASIINFLRLSSYNILAKGADEDFNSMKSHLKAFVLYGIKN